MPGRPDQATDQAGLDQPKPFIETWHQEAAPPQLLTQSPGHRSDHDKNHGGGNAKEGRKGIGMLRDVEGLRKRLGKLVPLKRMRHEQPGQEIDRQGIHPCQSITPANKGSCGPLPSQRAHGHLADEAGDERGCARAPHIDPRHHRWFVAEVNLEDGHRQGEHDQPEKKPINLAGWGAVVHVKALGAVLRRAMSLNLDQCVEKIARGNVNCDGWRV